VPIRLVLAEDNCLLREGMSRLIEAQLELVAACEDFDSLVAADEAHRPHVVLTDIRMPPTGTNEGIRAAEHLRQTLPRRVVLSQYADPQYALQFLEHGARGRGFLLKERASDIDQLLAAIQEVVRGGSVIDPKVIDALVVARSQGAVAAAGHSPSGNPRAPSSASGRYWKAGPHGHAAGGVGGQGGGVGGQRGGRRPDRHRRLGRGQPGPPERGAAVTATAADPADRRAWTAAGFHDATGAARVVAGAGR